MLLNKIDSWKLVPLNIKGKRYTNRNFKYKDIATTVRLKKIAILTIQKTKLKEKKEKKSNKRKSKNNYDQQQW